MDEKGKKAPGEEFNMDSGKKESNTPKLEEKEAIAITAKDKGMDVDDSKQARSWSNSKEKKVQNVQKEESEGNSEKKEVVRQKLEDDKTIGFKSEAKGVDEASSIQTESLRRIILSDELRKEVKSILHD